MQLIYTLLWYKIHGLDFLPIQFDKHRQINTQSCNNIQASQAQAHTPNQNTNVKEIKSSLRKVENIKNINAVKNIDSFEKVYRGITNLECQIKNTARNTVVADGPLNSKIMLIGEAPGQEEDIQGKPFVGQSGILLNNMLLAVGIRREDILISNIVFWRPPGNRNPSQEEITLCLPYVYRLIKLVQPKVIMLLGSIAVHALLENKLPISKQRGKLNLLCGITTISTYHPAYLLRAPYNKFLVFRDFILLKKIADDANH